MLFSAEPCSNAINAFLSPPCSIEQPFLSDPGIPGVRSMGPSVSNRGCSNLTYVTLADEVINSIPTVNANRAIQGNVGLQVAPSGGKIWN